MVHLLKKILDKLPLYEDAPDITNDATFWDLVKKADFALPPDAEHAISSWVGGGPDYEENKAIGFGLMSTRRLELAFSDNPTGSEWQLATAKKTKEELEQAIRPIREYLQKKYGPVINLSRGYNKGLGDRSEVRTMFSFTSNKQVATGFAGSSTKKEPKVLTVQEIDAIMKQYELTGQVKVFGTTYIRNENDPMYADIYDREDQHVTDTDDVRYNINSDNEWRLEIIAKNNALKKRVRTFPIPVDDIVWVTNRFGQHEFIVHGRSDAQIGEPIFENLKRILSPTKHNIEVAKAFVLKKWKERASERGYKEPNDLSSSCKFSSLFAQKIFGGTIFGNENHQYVKLSNGIIIDLNIDAEDVKLLASPHSHDEEFWKNTEHKESMKSCIPRVNRWVEEFKKLTS